MSAERLLDELGERARALGREVGPRVEAERDEEQAARAALAALAEADLVRWAVPARDGGADAGPLAAPDTISVRALARLRAELARWSGMLEFVLAMQGLGSFPIALAGSDELRAEVLPAVARGERIAAFALTEPSAGSALTDVATRAERAGAGWRVEGRKTFISNVPIAHFYTLLARTSGAPGEKQGLSMLFVPADAWGVDLEPFEVLAPHPIGDLVLKGVELPERCLIGREGEGARVALGTLARFRATVAAAACGYARRALEETIRHLKERRQAGVALAEHQALRFDVADMDTRLRAAELLVEEAARLSDEGADRAVAGAAVARAKLFATEAAGWICDRAVQLHGGLGVKRGTPVERLYREVRALRIYEGTSEVQRLVLAKELLG